MPATCVPWPFVSCSVTGDRRRDAAGVGGERGVDVRLQPHGAAVVVGQLGMEIGRADARNRGSRRRGVVPSALRRSAWRKSTPVSTMATSAPAPSRPVSARAAGAPIAGPDASSSGRRIRRSSIVSTPGSGDETSQLGGRRAQVGDVAGELTRVEAGGAQASGAAGHANRHERAAVAGADRERIGGELAASDEADATDDDGRGENGARSGEQHDHINEGERAAHLEATRHGMLSEPDACSRPASEPRRGAGRRRA